MSPSDKLYLARVSAIDKINYPNITPICKILCIFKSLSVSLDQQLPKTRLICAEKENLTSSTDYFFKRPHLQR